MPGQQPRGVWRGWLLGFLPFIAILGFMASFFLLPLLPFRDNQLLTFSCEASGSLGACDQTDSVARFFAEVCGRDDVTLVIDQSRFRTGLSEGTLTPGHFSLQCQPRDVITSSGGTVQETRGFPYLEESSETSTLYAAWLRGEVSAADARERLLGTP